MTNPSRSRSREMRNPCVFFCFHQLMGTNLFPSPFSVCARLSALRMSPIRGQRAPSHRALCHLACKAILAWPSWLVHDWFISNRKVMDFNGLVHGFWWASVDSQFFQGFCNRFFQGWVLIGVDVFQCSMNSLLYLDLSNGADTQKISHFSGQKYDKRPGLLGYFIFRQPHQLVVLTVNI